MSGKRPFRTNDKLQIVHAEVQQALGDSVICARCGATLATYADNCSADLGDPCPGFLRIEEVRNPIVAKVYGSGS